MAGSVEQIEHRALVLEGHHRGGDGNPALLLDLHPVGARAPGFAACFHLSGKTNRATQQKQLLGQRGFAGVRMRDDGKAPPPRRLRCDPLCACSVSNVHNSA